MTALFEQLADDGLLMQGEIPVGELDHVTVDALTSAGYDPEQFDSLLLFGQAGGRLWEKHVSTQLDRANPFDDIAIELVRNAFAEHAPDAQIEVVYPGDALVPLGTLAERVGWGTTSPLGLTINPTYGLWLAHRVVVLSAITRRDSRPTSADTNICQSCESQACVVACPADAVSLTEGYNVRACAEHRAPEGSSCELTCLARIACPVGVEFQYGDAQMTHHYRHGLTSVRAWVEGFTHE